MIKRDFIKKQSAVSNQQSAIRCQQSAISYQMAAIGCAPWAQSDPVDLKLTADR
jgi:hypothetical protein